MTKTFFLFFFKWCTWQIEEVDGQRIDVGNSDRRQKGYSTVCTVQSVHTEKHHAIFVAYSTELYVLHIEPTVKCDLSDLNIALQH